MSNWKRQHRICTDVLPIDVDMQGEGLPPEADLVVVLSRKGEPNKTQRLHVVKCSECEITVRVPPECAKWGPGVYKIAVMDTCALVCSIQLELSARCAIHYASHTAVTRELKS